MMSGGARRAASEGESEQETLPRGVPQTAAVYESRARLFSAVITVLLFRLFIYIFCLSQ